MMGLTYLMSLNLLIILRPKKCVNYIEHWGKKKPKPAKPINLGCQTRRTGLDSGSLLGEPALIPGVYTHQVAPV